MDRDPRRAYPRFKDDRRVCRAFLEETSGETVELNVIDMSIGGAALCHVNDARKVPKTAEGALNRGRLKMRLPSLAGGKRKRNLDVGDYKVVRRWPTGPGPEAGIAVKFTKPLSGWVKALEDERLAESLTGQ